MKRRQFITVALGAAAAVAAGISTRPIIVRPVLNGDKVGSVEHDINPAWLNAPYEVSFLFGRDAFKRLEWEQRFEAPVNSF